MTIKVGDNVSGQWPEKARVMAIAEGYAMVRRKGCMPFIESVKDLERWNPKEVGNDE